jgi:sterol 3beta-glucosyltransferase
VSNTTRTDNDQHDGGLFSMVEIAIVASGTRGDVQPYVALGRGLKNAGYHVRLLTNDSFESLVTEAGLTFCSTGESVEALLQNEEWRKTVESGNFMSILLRMRSEMQRGGAEIARRLPGLLNGSDLIVTGTSGMTGVFSVADMLKIPVIEAHVVPFTPTHEFPSPLTPRLPFGRALNWWSFHLMRQMMWQTLRVGDVATREVLGLEKPSLWRLPSSPSGAQAPILYGYSPHVLPRPRDWPEHEYVTGYWFLDAPSGWTPPADLMAFLEAGEPPVYIGFGSMGSRNPEVAGRIALEALERSGQRGILATGWGGLRPSNVPKNVHLISSIPHTWLFSRMAAVVHHGGAGTTAAGLRAGVPSIVVPFMADQPFWGKRVADLGVGPQPIPKKQLSGKRLAEAISEAVSNTGMRQRAHALGQNIRAEDGIAASVAIVERFIQQRALARVY